MIFTAYGKALAAAEPIPTLTSTGATAHAEAIAYDAGIRVLITGRTYDGKRFSRSARSVYGAYAAILALGGAQRAWHVREDGTRRLILTR